MRWHPGPDTTDMSRRDEDGKRALSRYEEWIANRYNPGYWTGGKVPPSVRNVWSTRDRKFVGWIFIAASLVGTAYAFTETNADSIDELFVVGILTLVPLMVVGVMLLLNLPKPR